MNMQEQAMKEYSYDPDTGVVFSKKRNRVITKNSSFKGKQYRPYQIAFLLMEGYIPETVDHKNGNRSDNTWSNLRAATRHQQSANTRKVGVYKTKSGTWYSQLCVKGVRYYSGTFKTKEEAQTYHTNLCKDLQGEFAVQNSRGDTE